MARKGDIVSYQDLREQAKDRQWLQRAIRATRDSIEKKWKKIKTNQEKDLGPNNCSLCIEFLKGPGLGCGTCPICIYTELDACDRTPWDDWDNHQARIHGKGLFGPAYIQDGCIICKKLADKEIAFLEKILKWLLKFKQELHS